MDLKKLISLLSFAFLCFSCKNSLKTHVFSGYALGTSFKIVYSSEEELYNIEELTDSIFFQINRSLSTYLISSDISKINNGIDSIIVDSHFKNVFNQSKIIWESSNGFFDPTVGSLVNAYGLGPNLDTSRVFNIDSLMNLTGFENVTLLNDRIVKKKIGIFLDFNAIAKGYCVDVISKMLIDNQITNHLIEIGGEMYASGLNRTTNTPWRVGIADPLNSDPNSYNLRLALKNMALASSGNYRKFLIDSITGRKIVHTVNPKNGNAYSTNVLGTSVLADSCMSADGYATAFMAMPLEESIALMNSLLNIEAMIVYLDEENELKTYFTKNFEDLILD